MGLADVAKKEKSTNTKKAKGVIVDLNDEVEANVNKWVEANRTYKDAKATMEQTEKEILDYVEPKWKQTCRSEGHVENTAKVGSLRISWKGKSQFCTSVDPERAQQVFGDDYDRYFKTIQSFEINPEAANHPEVSEKLVEAIQAIQEEYPDIDVLKVKEKTIPTDIICNDWVLGKGEEIQDRLDAAGIKRTKPTFAQR